MRTLCAGPLRLLLGEHGELPRISLGALEVVHRLYVARTQQCSLRGNATIASLDLGVG